ncbi:hypothetical protein [Marinobacterium lutimaris]|nr:hypothetical protein [Marinobacterium lutimaris]
MAELQAEAKGQPAISFSDELLHTASTDPTLASLLDEANKRFELIKELRQEKQTELRHRIQSAESSIDAQQQQLSDNRDRLAMVNRKIESLEPAVEKGLIGENYLSALSTEVEQLSAQSDDLEHSIEQIKWSVAEYSLQLRKQDSERQRVVKAQLNTLAIRKRQADRLEEKLVASESVSQSQKRGYQSTDSQSFLHSSME